MVEVVKREMAKMNMCALTLRWMHAGFKSGGFEPRGPGVLHQVEAAKHLQVRFPLRFRICVIMIRTADELSRNVGESQPLPWF